jgi:group I intron endonuclease
MTKTIYFGIYEVKNTLNGKSYIGQSAIDVHGRCNSHIKDIARGRDNQHLTNAVTMYGIENFSFKVILYCEEFELTRYEDMLINIDRSNHYNIRPAADSNKGVMHSEEFKKKVSESLIGNQRLLGHVHTKESRQQMSLHNRHAVWMKGKHHSEKTKRKMSEARMGHTMPDVTRCGLAKANIGRVLSVETRNKISKARIGTVMSDDVRRVVSKSLLGNQHAKGKTWKLSEETKHNMSEAQKLRFQKEHDVWECT